MPDMDWYTTRNLALTVGCPWCHALPGERCVVPKTDIPLEKFSAHIPRIKLANTVEAEQ